MQHQSQLQWQGWHWKKQHNTQHWKHRKQLHLQNMNWLGNQSKLKPQPMNICQPCRQSNWNPKDRSLMDRPQPPYPSHTLPPPSRCPPRTPRRRPRWRRSSRCWGSSIWCTLSGRRWWSRCPMGRGGRWRIGLRQSRCRGRSRCLCRKRGSGWWRGRCSLRRCSSGA